MDVQVAKVRRHHVYGGARSGSLKQVYVNVLYSDGSTTPGNAYEPSEPLARCDSGRAALAAYVRTKIGAKIAKYMPSHTP